MGYLGEISSKRLVDKLLRKRTHASQSFRFAGGGPLQSLSQAEQRPKQRLHSQIAQAKNGVFSVGFRHFQLRSPLFIHGHPMATLSFSIRCPGLSLAST